METPIHRYDFSCYLAAYQGGRLVLAMVIT